MAYVNAQKAEYVLVSLCGQPALFTEDRLDSESVPENLRLYHVRHTDDDTGVPSTVEPSVTVNYYGAIVTSTKIDFGDGDYLNFDDIVEVSDDDYTMDEYLDEFAANSQ